MAEPATDTSPDMSGHNPFQLLAFLLFKVRHSIEDADTSGRDPRWIRIARARQSSGGAADAIGGVVKTGIDGFSEAIAYMQEITLDIKELLVQTDAGKALVEASIDLVTAATSPEFQNGVRALINQPPAGDALGGISGALQDMKQYLDYIPEPDDVEGLGHELYRLMCIEQIPLPLKGDGSVDETQIPPNTTDHIEKTPSGKIRLMQWAFGHNTPTFGLGTKEQPESTKMELTRLGARRLWKPSGPDKLPNANIIKYIKGSSEETIVEQFFDSRESDATKHTMDIEELHSTLEKLGYIDPQITPEERKAFGDYTVKRLRKFQIVNDLSRTGLLDNDTLNRLLNLDFENKNICRAKPFDQTRMDGTEDDPNVTGRALKLVNPDANHWQDEGLSLLRDKPGYAYYVAGRTLDATDAAASLKEKGGWIRDVDKANGIYDGFVALQSRILVDLNSDNLADIFDGGKYSEGEAQSPLMFYCARHTQPWKAARVGNPGSDSLFQDQAPITGNYLSRMYQWVSVKDIVTAVPDGYEMKVKAHVSIRSLWCDKNTHTNLSDQGRIFIEFYKSTVFKATTGLATPRDPSKLTDLDKTSVDGEFHGTDRAHSAWMPENTTTASAQCDLANLKRKRNWIGVNTYEMLVPSDTVAILVGLEGKHQSAFDTDAYFDDVRLTYSINKKPA